MAVESDTGSWGHVKVVAVDDDRNFLRVLKCAVQKLGIDLICFEEGTAALEYILQGDIDLLLLDLGLPDITADDLVDRLNKSNRAVPFILITALSDTALAVDWMRHGAADYLVKTSELIEMIPAVIERTLKQLKREKKLVEVEDSLRLVQSAVEQASDGVVIFTSDETDPSIVYCNKSFSLLLQTTPETLEGQKMSRLEVLYKEFTKVIENADLAAAGDYECRWIGIDGRPRELSLQAFPVLNRLNQVISFMVWVRDVTKHNRVLRQLSEAQKLESIGRLASGVAHEVNTPIQYVHENLRFLEKSANEALEILDKLKILASKGQENSLDEIRRAIENLDLNFLKSEVPGALNDSLEGIDHVTKIVKTMNEFSHPGTGKKVRFDINRAIEGAIMMTRTQWKHHAQVLTYLDPSMPLIDCVPDEIQRVVLNLITNAVHAVKHAEPLHDKGWKGTIAIRSRYLGNNVEMRIRDTGAGIPEQHCPRIFEPFFTTKGVGEGTGQGLAMSRTIVLDRHEGSLDFETEEGKGTIFIMTLPVGIQKEMARNQRSPKTLLANHVEGER